MPHTPLFQRFLRVLRQAQRANCPARGVASCPPGVRAPWSRRHFIQTTALMGATGLVASVLPATRAAVRPGDVYRPPVIAIIGGGLAGLQAAYQLQQAGVYATVYEACGRLGGRILSCPYGSGADVVADLGGEFINTDHADMLRLAQVFGLRLFNRRQDARRFPFPAVGFYLAGQRRTEAEVAAHLQPLAAQIAQDAARLENDYGHVAPTLDMLSVTAYLDQHVDKIAAPFIRSLVEESIRTEYGVEPEASSALQLISHLPAGQGQRFQGGGPSDETVVLEGGSSRLIQALAQALAGQIHTHMALRRIAPQGSGFRLEFVSGQVVEAEVVILALPFPVLRELEVQVPLPQRLWRFINEASLGVNEKLLMGFAKRIWRRADGFVMEAWADLGCSALWDETQRYPGREDGALTFFCGGRAVQSLQVGSTADQLARLLGQFERFLPGAATAATGPAVRSHWTQNRLSGGSYSSFQPGQLTLFGDWLWSESDDPAQRQEVHVGNLVFAGEHVSAEFYGFMNGAAQTGRLAAEYVLRRLAPQAPR
ncbi:MAG: FAD-dependent oxidoreductase [Candidatus Tectimicrobiota bacterium]